MINNIILLTVYSTNILNIVNKINDISRSKIIYYMINKLTVIKGNSITIPDDRNFN